MAVVTTTVSGQVRVSAQVDTGRDIYVGESFGYYIVIQGTDKPGQVDLEPLRQYNPHSTGNRRQRSTNIINNKVTTTITTIMTYSLAASQAGQTQLPSLTVEVDGKTYRTNPVSANILKPGTTDQLDLEVTLSEQQCFAGQPVLLMVKFYYSAEIRNPQFNIPVLSSDAFYFENPDVLTQQVKEYDLGTGTTVLVSQHQVVHNNKQSNLIILRKILIPKTAGLIRIEPTAVSADVAVGRTRSRDPFDSFFGSQLKYKRFMVNSEPLELTVLPLPDQGKPAQFYGLVGQYTISASATPTKVNVGDPITLTIKIGGGRYLKPVQWPALEQVPGLAANFKIPSQKASPTIESGFKVFTQTIRANNDKVTEIPSLPLVYFDAEKGKYVTAKTEPISLEVAPTKILTGADLEGADLAPINKEVEAIKKGLSANYEGLDVLQDMGFSPLAALARPSHTVIWAVPLIAFLSSLFIKLLTHTSPEKVAAKRRRQARGKAVGQLKKIASTDAERRNELLVSVMKQYIGDRFDKTAGSLTADDCHDAIIAATTDVRTADKYRETIANFEAGRYASMKINISSDKIKEVIELIRNIEKNCAR
jgi:hypothetical protein